MPSLHPQLVILYVRNPAESAAFYAQALERQPLEASPGFVMFELAGGLMLGLWLASEVRPAAGPAGGAEVALRVDSIADVHATHAAWAARGWPVAQAPEQMDFGFTFTVRDPDGHALRVFCPAPQ